MKNSYTYYHKTKYLLTISLTFFCFLNIRAQDETVEAKKKSFARSAFESSLLIDNQSSVVPSAKTLQFDMMHRFGTLDKGIEDLYGFFAPSNIKMGLTYTVIENLSLGVGITKFNKYLDFSAKYAIFKQGKGAGMPLNITYFGNVAIDTRNAENFDEQVHRLTFFHELIFSRRITPKLSLQISPSFSHFNAVDSLLSNDIIAASLGGRYKFSSQSSFIFEYTQPITEHDGLIEVQPNISAGIEVSTSSHAFQIFVGSYQGIVNQQNIVFNENKLEGSGLLIGFNITRLWNY